MPAGIGAVTRLGDQPGGAHAVDQRQHFVDGMAAMERGATDIAIARAGDQRDRSLDPARQPHRDALPGSQALAREARGEPVGGAD